MTSKRSKVLPTGSNAFEQLAKGEKGKDRGIVSEFAHFIWSNKLWWMIPIALCLLAFGVLLALGSTGAAPFIYSLF